MDLGVRAVGDGRKRLLEVDKVVIVANTLVVAVQLFEEGVFGCLVFTFGAGTEVKMGDRRVGTTKEAAFLHEVPAGFVTSEGVDGKLRRVGLWRSCTGPLVLG